MHKHWAETPAIQPHSTDALSGIPHVSILDLASLGTPPANNDARSTPSLKLDIRWPPNKALNLTVMLEPSAADDDCAPEQPVPPDIPAPAAAMAKKTLTSLIVDIDESLCQEFEAATAAEGKAPANVLHHLLESYIEMQQNHVGGTEKRDHGLERCSAAMTVESEPINAVSLLLRTAQHGAKNGGNA